MFDPKGIKLNLKPSAEDSRDFKLAPFLFHSIQVKESSDLSTFAGKVRNQLSLGSCVGHGCYAIYDLVHFAAYGTHFDGSPGFVYNLGQMAKKTLGKDTGLTIRDGIKALAKHGICAEHLFPYIEDNWYKQPPKEALADGLRHQAVSYYRIFGVDMIRMALSMGHPVIIGKYLYASSMSAESLNSGIIRQEAKDKKPIGGHCTIIVGHSDKEKMFTEQNSWGTDVGLPEKRGFFKFSYEYAEKNIMESWIVTKAENDGEVA